MISKDNNSEINKEHIAEAIDYIYKNNPFPLEEIEERKVKLMTVGEYESRKKFAELMIELAKKKLWMDVQQENKTDVDRTKS